jgi:hypothetical protein
VGLSIASFLLVNVIFHQKVFLFYHLP